MSLSDLMSGYGGFEFQLPMIAGQYQGKGLVVCGDAACIWNDLELFGAACHVNRGSVRKDDWDFMTINKLVEVFPGHIEHAYSNEPALLHKFIAARRSEYVKEFEGPRHTHSCNAGAKWRWPWGGHGTSALGAALVGIGLGYDALVLAGIPLDDRNHNGEPHWRKCRFESSEAAGPKDIPFGQNRHWKRAIDLAFEGKVKSMSGRTRDWLGAP